MPGVGVISAFFGGLVSFISPCVLPLIPGYLSFISGISVDQLEDMSSKQKRLIISRAILFSAGFTIVFTILGMTASTILSPLSAYRRQMEQVAGLLIIFAGLAISGLFKIPFLNVSKGINFKGDTSSAVGSLLLGMAFAVAWTPCVGPILGSILFYAGSGGTVSSGGILLLIYSMGLAIPMIVTAIAFSRMLSFFGWIKRRYAIIMAVSGALLILMGGFLLFGKFAIFSLEIQKFYNKLNFNIF